MRHIALIFLLLSAPSLADIHEKPVNIGATACWYHVKAKYPTAEKIKWIEVKTRYKPSGLEATYKYRVTGQALPVVCTYVHKDSEISVT